MEHWQYSELFGIANAALSATTRNCDELSKDDVLNGQKRLEIKNECGGNL